MFKYFLVIFNLTGLLLLTSCGVSGDLVLLSVDEISSSNSVAAYCQSALSNYDEVGDGSEASPYIICSADQLYDLSQDTTAWSSYFRQEANIDMAQWHTDNPGTYFQIGECGANCAVGPNTAFTGSYNGNSNSISNYEFDDTTERGGGLFGAIEFASITSLTMIDASVRAGYDVGIMVGYSEESYMNDVHASAGEVHAWNGFAWQTNAGGIVGYVRNGGTISNCSSSATVKGVQYVGGVVGYFVGAVSEHVRMINCNSSATVWSTGSYVGGLLGQGVYAYASVSYVGSSATVSGGGFVGGFAGAMGSASVANVFSWATVVGSGNYNGGLVGEFNTGTLTNSYSTGSVSGTNYIGGLLGECQDMTLDQVFTTSDITANTAIFWGHGKVRGRDSTCTESNYYAASDSSVTNPGGGTILSGEDVTQTKADFQSAAPVPSPVSSWDTTDVWQVTGTGYPILR